VINFSQILFETYGTDINDSTIGKYLYHGTTVGAALRIQKNGLKPHNVGEGYPTISFSPEIDVAISFGKRKGGKNTFY
jgi:RNA:NAD 2'-phosphotransferase (TPT1/KptA family)